MVARKTDINYITNRLTIENVCRAFNIPTPQPGKNIKCPLGTHEDKNPSFTLDDKKGKVLYHCKSCQNGGDALDLIMHMHNLDKNKKEDFVEGLKKACEIAGIPYEDDEDEMPKVSKSKPQKTMEKSEKEKTCHELVKEKKTHDPDLIAKIQKSYKEKKGIDVSKLNVIYMNTGDFAVPMYNETGKVCGYQTGNKYIVRGSKLGCFVNKIDPKEDLHVVEGLSDFLSMVESGKTNTISLCSATTPDKAVMGVIDIFYFNYGGKGNINICLDFDGVDDEGLSKSSEEGFTGAKKATQIAEKLDRYSRIYFASTEEKKDINDVYREEGVHGINKIFEHKEDIIDLQERIGDREKKAKPPVIANRIMDKEILASENGNLWRYEKGVWTKLIKNEPEKFVKDFIRSEMHKLPINTLITQTRDQVIYDSSDRGRGLLEALARTEEYFSKNEGIIFLEDCKYNVLTGEKFIYTPEDYVISTLAGDSNFAGETCSRFKEFLHQIFEGDYDIKDRILFMQELFGYCMYPQVPQEKLFGWIGKGGNGKGTLMETLSHMVGPNNRKNMEISRLDQNGFALSQLIGIYVNSCSEERKGVPLSSPTLKMLTGGDRVTTDRKFSTDLDFKPFCKVIISLNDSPSVSEDSDWLARRLMMLWFNNNFDNWQQGRRGDPNLKLNLRKEIVGIRAWAIEGLQRLLTNGRFTEPESMRDQTVRFLQRHDKILQFYIRKLVPQVDFTKTRFKLHDLYMEYRDYHENYTASMRGVYHFETFVSRIRDVSSACGEIDYGTNELVFDWGKFNAEYRKKDVKAMATAEEDESEVTF